MKKKLSNPVVQTLLRSALKIGAGYLVAKGYTDADGAEQITGAVVGVSGVLWGVFHRKEKRNKQMPLAL